MEKINTSGIKIYKSPFIYITYCFHPDKFLIGYIGSHCINDPNYLGSGSLLKCYIKKFGSLYFKRFILDQLENKTRQEVLDREQYWINYFDAINSNLFFNQQSYPSGGFVVKDLKAHGEKTKEGMVRNNAYAKIKKHANTKKSKDQSRQNLKLITKDDRDKARKTRSQNKEWKNNIIKRNKKMPTTKIWQDGFKLGLIKRDRFIITPEGIFKNATDAGKFFGVSNVSILKKINDLKNTEWHWSMDKTLSIIDVSKLEMDVIGKMKQKYFSRKANNRQSITVNGVKYESKFIAKKKLGWGQVKLDNYLKRNTNG